MPFRQFPERKSSGSFIVQNSHRNILTVDDYDLEAYFDCTVPSNTVQLLNHWIAQTSIVGIKVGIISAIINNIE